MTKKIEYTDTQLRKALAKEWEYLCHDDFNPEEDMTQREYEDYLLNQDTEMLIEETCTDDRNYTLKEFMDYWGEEPNE
tara:strand:+ start:113 stop:346 length:234 start_codon:yes stop_codon:yes gene_type:complete